MKKLTMDASKEQLIADFKVMAMDAEALLHATTAEGGEKFQAVRAKAEESLNMVKARLADAQDELVAKTRAAAKATDVYVHDNPWQAVGVAAGIGMVIGLLVGRR